MIVDRNKALVDLRASDGVAFKAAMDVLRAFKRVRGTGGKALVLKYIMGFGRRRGLN